MAVTPTGFVLTSVVCSAIYVYVHRLSQPSHSTVLSYVWTLAQLLLLELLSLSVWKLVLRPRYFSPLRHIPTPGVSFGGSSGSKAGELSIVFRAAAYSWDNGSESSMSP